MGFAFQEFLEDINGPKGLRAASEAARNAGEKYVPTESIDAIETMLRSSYGDYSMGYMNINRPERRPTPNSEGNQKVKGESLRSKNGILTPGIRLIRSIK